MGCDLCLTVQVILLLVSAQNCLSIDPMALNEKKKDLKMKVFKYIKESQDLKKNNKQQTKTNAGQLV